MENKNIFAENLRKQMRERNVSRRDLSDALGISYYTVTSWVNGTKYPRMDKVEILADYFGIKKSDLIEERSERKTVSVFDNLLPIEVKRFPLLGEIACGKPILANEDKELYVEAGANIQADFCLRAKGDSMIGARICDGDIVFIQQRDMVDDGEIAAVIIEDEVTLKRLNYYPGKNLLILKPENTKYEDLVYTGEELDHIRILGRAVAFQSDIR